MFKVTKKHTRPNTDVAFFNKDNGLLSAEYAEYFRSTYVTTGKFIDRAIELSSDGLEQTNTIIWVSKADADAYLADPIVQAGFFGPSESYMNSNGIQTIVVSAEEI